MEIASNTHLLNMGDRPNEQRVEQQTRINGNNANLPNLASANFHLGSNTFMPPTAMYAQPQPSVNNRPGQDYNLLEGNRISATNLTAASWTNTFAPPETLGSWGRGYRSNPQHNSPNNTANWWERNSTRDCGKIVKEWGIRFTGEGGMRKRSF